uniref:Angiopoietin-1 n=1 Tax=Sphaerodactylus townsendi TaxID=933632 RepID=A0ACB8FET0_9SAUR
MKHCLLDHKILDMEERHKGELDTLKEEKENLQGLVSRQSYIIQELERQLNKATTNNSMLQKQQLELMDTVHSLVSLCSKEGDRLVFEHNVFGLIVARIGCDSAILDDLEYPNHQAYKFPKTMHVQSAADPG